MSLKITRLLPKTFLLFSTLLFLSTRTLAQICGLPGSDGPATPSASVNTYFPSAVPDSVAAGASSIALGATSGTSITAGDLVLIIQMQGVRINTSNLNSYGDGVAGIPGAGNSTSGTDYIAGKYEYGIATNTVTAAGGTLNLQNPLTNYYVSKNASTASAPYYGNYRFQVIRVPQYSSVTLTGNITTQAWDGAKGGVFAMDVSGNMNFAGFTISVAGRGFRGGGGRQLGGAAGTFNTDYITLATQNANGSKGEGIAGTPRYLNNAGALLDNTVEGYPLGSYGRGAPGNAGGGGTDGNPTSNDQNSGGGGGGNFSAGGRGGNAWNNAPIPGGDGGAAFASVANSRLVMGGGAGAGTSNNGTGTPGSGFASSGGAGGGIVMLRTGSVSGTGNINADGVAPGMTPSNDASGGGGAGGSVIFTAANTAGLANITVTARGGDGGSNTGGGADHGPGGGGGGGVIYSNGTISAGSSTAQGTNGVTFSGNVYGAQASTVGFANFSASNDNIPNGVSGSACLPVLTVTKSTSTPGPIDPLANATYEIVVSNAAGAGAAAGVTISDNLPTPTSGTITFNGTSSVVLGGTIPATRPSTTNPTVGSTAPAWGSFTIPGGASVTLTFTAAYSALVNNGLFQNPATVSFTDPTRTVGSATVSPGGTYSVGGTVGGSNYNSASSSNEDVRVCNSAAAGPDQTLGLCGTTATLAANNPQIGAGLWTIIAGVGGSVTTPSSPTSTFTGVAGSSYTLRWTITAGVPCGTTFDDVLISFSLGAAATASNAGPDQSVCAASATLAGNTSVGHTGLWTVVSGVGGSFVSNTTNNTTFNGTAGVSYTLRWTLTRTASGCTSSDDVVINLVANPSPAANAGPDQSGATLCGLSASLAGNTPTIGTGTWSIISGAGGTIASLNSPTSTFSGSSATAYTLRWTISNAPCASSTDDVVVTFPTQPNTANAGPDQTRPCNATTATLAANSPTGSNTGAWSVISGTGGSFSLATNPSATFTGTAGRTYVLRWTITSTTCGTSTDDVTIILPNTPTANAGPDQTNGLTCTVTTLTLAGNVPSGSTGLWTIVSGAGGSFADATAYNTTLTGVSGTAYVVRWTLTNACGSSSDDVNITFNAQITANAGPDQASVCGTSATLAANSASPKTGTWSIIAGAGGAVTSVNSETSTFTGTAGTSYTLRWSINNSPCFNSQDDVAISFATAPTTSNAGPDQTAAATCGLTSVTLAANNPTSGVGAWTIVSGTGGSFANAAVRNTTFSGTAGSAYTLRWTISTGCASSTDDVLITFNQNPTTSNAGSDQSSCLTSVVLGANTPIIGTGTWSIISGAGGSFSLNTNPTATFTGTAGVTYVLRWTIANAPCTASTDDVSIALSTGITANAGPDQNICGTNTTLAANNPTLPSVGAWTVISGVGGSFSNASSASSTFTGAAGTSYTLRWTVTTPSCPTVTDDVDINFNTAPTASNAGTDQSVCLLNVVLAANTPLVGTGAWSIVSGAGGSFALASNPTTTFTGTSNTNYVLRWTITNGGCTSTDDVAINILQLANNANAGTDITTACGTVTTALNGNGPGGGHTGLWTIVSGSPAGSFSNATSSSSNYTGTSGVSYVLRWTRTRTSSGCTSSDDVNVTLAANPTTANAGADQTGLSTCGLTIVALTANTPTIGTGAWSIISGTGGSFANTASATSNFSGTAGTTYVLRWTISTLTCGNSTDDVTITFNNNPTTANAGADQVNLCGVTSTTLAANAPTNGTGTWTIISGVGGSFSLNTNPAATFTGTLGTTYVLRWTIANAPCTSSTDDVTITFNNNPTTSNAGADQVNLCGVTSTTLAANTPTIGTGTWTIISGVGGSFSLNTNPAATFTGTLGTTYVLRWTIANAPCTNSTDDVTITFNNNPTTSNAGADQVNLCGVTSTTLAANTPTNGTGTWTIISGVGGSFALNTDPATTFTGTLGTTYVLRWTIANAPCTSSTDDVTITFNNNPTTSNAGADQVNLCGVTSTTLAANAPTNGTGTWTIISGVGGSFSLNTNPAATFTGTLGTTYVLRWTIANAPCTNSTDDVTITFNNNPTTSNAGADQINLCGVTSTTLAANTPTVGTGTWTIISGVGGSFSLNTNPAATFTGTLGTTYVLRWTIANAPCTSSTDDVTITFNNNPTIANAGADQTNLCGVTSTTLAANTPTVGTGTWSIISGAGGSFALNTDPATTFTGTLGTTYVLRWTIANAPCASGTDDVTITFNNNPTTSNAGADQVNLCGVTSTTLAANAPTNGTGTWTIISGVGGSFSLNTNPAATFTGTLGTTYVLRWTIANAPCTSSTDDVTITFNNNPTTSNAGADQVNLCGVTSTTLAANAPTNGTGTWTIISGVGGSFSLNTNPAATFTGTLGTTYVLRWTIANAPCTSSTDDVTITFNNNPTTSNAGADQTNLCGVTSTTLAANTPTNGTGTWTIISGVGGSFALNTDPATTFTGTLGTTYVLRWTIANAPCTSSTDDVTITFNNNPTTSNAGADQVNLCGVTSTTLAANTPTNGTGTWTIISGVGGSFSLNTNPAATFTGTLGTTYVLRWTIANAPCTSSTDDVTITFNNNPTTSNAGADQVNLCGVTSTTLAANAPTNGTGTWTIISGVGGSFSLNTNPAATFTGTLGTTYVLRWTIANAPCTSSTDDVTITFNNNPTTSNAGADQVNLCGVTSTTLAANAPTNGTGTWTIISGVGGSFSLNTNPAATFTGTLGTTYVLRWTIANAPCTSSTDDVTITFNNNPTTSIAGADQLNLCGVTSTTLAANSPTVGTGTWTIISGVGGSFSLNTNPAATFTGILGTTYVLRWTIANAPCTSSTDDVTITFNNNPTTSNAGADQVNLCGVTSTTLAANAPTNGTGTWTIISGVGGSFSLNTNPAATFTGTLGTTYVLRWTIANAPCTSSTDDVTITFNNNPTTSNAGADQTNLCGVTSTALAANTPTVGTGTWTIISGVGGSFSLNTNPAATFTGTLGTTYVLRWTIANAPCTSSTDDVTITFNNNPTTANAGADQTNLCGVTSTTLAANTPTVGTGTWSIISGAGGSFSLNTDPATTFTGTLGTTYVLRWTIANAPCTSSTDDVTITFNNNPTTSNAGADQVNLCGVTSTTLAANAPTNGTGTWTIISGVGGSFSLNTNPAATFTGILGTTYVLRWTIANAPCTSSTDDVTITFNNNPTTANAGADQTNLCGVTSTILAANAPTNGIGTWTIISGVGGSFALNTDPTTTFTGTLGTTYVLRWTIANAPCTSSTDDVTITFNNNPTTANAGADQVNLCGVASTTLAANTPTVGAGTWSIVSGVGGSFALNTDPATTFTGTLGTTYVLRWTIANAPCTSSTDDVTITFNNNPTTANAGADQTNLCGVTSTALAANTPTVGTGTWSIISGAGGSFALNTDPATTFTGTLGTTYVLRWTIANAPCTSSADDVTITFNNNPTTSNAGADQTNLCGVTSTTLTANAPAIGTGTWSIISGAGGSFALNTDPATTFTGTLGTTYVLRWTIANAPCTSSADDVTITFNNNPTTSNAGADQTNLCGVTSTTLTANAPAIGTGTWSIISGAGGSFALNTDPATTFTGTLGTTYVLRWTIANAPCTSSTDDVTITFNNNPTTSNAGADQTNICGVTSTTLAANAPTNGTGTWTIISGVGGSFSLNTNPAATFTGTLGTTYVLRWTIANAPCTSSTDDVTITFNNNPTTANAGADQVNLCGVASTTLAANTPTVGAGTWTIISGVGGSFSLNTNPAATFTGTLGTTYVLRWTIANAPCTSSTDDVTITFNNNPTTANAGADQTNLCGVTSTTLAANAPTNGIGTWTIISGVGGSFSLNTNPAATFTGTLGTTYVLRWTIANAPCTSSTDDVNITFNNNPTTSNAGADQVNLCGVTSTTLAANTPTVGTGTWTIISGVGGSFVLNTDPATTFTGTLGTTYVLRWTIANAPCTSSTDDVTITFNNNPTTANAGADQTNLCGVTSTILAANAPTNGIGTWTIISGVGGSFALNTDPTTTFTGTLGTTYVLRWTIANAPCTSSTDDVTITFNNNPTTANAGADQVNLCGVASTTLAANTPTVGAGTWSIVSGVGGSFALNTDPATTFTGTLGTTYVLRWTIANAPCTSSTDDVTITFNNNPTTSNAGADQVNLCGVTSTTLAANTPTVGAGTWTIISGVGGSFSLNTNPAATFTGTLGTTYVLRWTIANAPCTSSTDDVTITFNNNPTTANAGADQVNLCGVTSTTLAANAPTNGTGTWTIISGVGGSFSLNTNPAATFTGTLGTTYVLRWTIANAPCTSSTDDVNITFNNNPTTSNAGADQVNLCGVTSTTLAANTPTVGTGTWTIISGVGGSFVLNTDPATTFTGTLGTTYVLRWTIANAPCTSSTDDVTITFNNNPTTANAGADQTNLCGVTSTALTANTPTVGAGTWSIVSGAGGSFALNTDPTTTFTGTLGTTYVLRWTIANAPCTSSTDDVTITFNNNPTTSNAGADQVNLCGVTSTTLAANTPTVGTGTWSIISGAGGSFALNTDPTTTFTGTLGTTYVLRWTIANAPCTSSTDDVTITFNNNPTTANAGADQTNLCGVTSTALAANTPTVGTGTWTIISGVGGSFSLNTNPAATFTGTLGTTYVLRWTIANAPCTSSTDDVTITFNNNPTTSNAGADQTNLCGVTSTTLTANTPTIGTGTWSIISGVGGSFSLNTNPAATFTGTLGTTYVLRWTIANAPCTSSTDDVTITFNNNPTTSNAGADQTNLCGVTSTALAANAPTNGTGTWTIISGVGGSFALNTDPATTFTGTLGTTYVLRWTIANAPCTSSTDDVTITFNNNPTTANAGADQTNLCGVTSTTLAANTPTLGTGTWTIISGVGGSFSLNTNPAATFTGTLGTTYVLRWTIANAPCTSSTDDVTITFNNNPTTSNAGADQTNLCGVTSTTLAANTPTVGTGTWSIISGAGGSFALNTDPATTFTGTLGTTYVLRWTIANAPCTSSTDDVTITFNNNPTTSNAGSDQIICGNSATMAANNAVIGIGTWTVITGTGAFTAINSPLSSVSGLSLGVNTFRWTISNAPCIDSFDDIEVTVTATPALANAGADQINLCGINSTFLTGNTPLIGSGIWSIVSGAGGSFSLNSDPTAIFTGTLGITYVLRWTISNPPCSDSFDDVTITFNENPTVANAGIDQTICSPTATLAANTPVVGTGSWTVTAGTGVVTTPSSPTSGVTGLSTGVNTFVWTITNGTCTPSTDAITINVDQLPTTSNAGIDQTICSPTATLAANTPAIGTGAWSVTAGTGVVTTPSSPTSGVTGLSTGVNTFTWTITNGTCTPSTDAITINVDQLPTTSNAGIDQTICSPTATLAANTPTVGTGAWTVTAGTGVVTTPSSPTSGVTGLTTGVNTFVWTITNGTCTPSTDAITINVDQLPTTSNAGIDQTICSPTATLAANTPAIGTGAWTVTAGTGVVTTPSSPTSGVTGLTTGVNTFVWTITNGTCTPSADAITINVDQLPTTSNAGIDQTICSPTATLAANTPTVGTGAWTVTAGTGVVTTPSSPTSGVTGLTTGVNTFVWTITNGTCTPSTDAITINVDQLPTTSNAGIDQTICSPTATLAANTPTIGTGAWTVTAGTGVVTTPSSPTSGVTGLSTGVNTFTWTITNGTCTPSTDAITINVDQLPTASNAGIDQTICSPTATLAANTPTVGTGAWTVTAGTGVVTTPSSPTSGVTGLTTGVNTFVWTITNGTCTPSTDAITINVDQLPTASNAGIDQTICSPTATLAANTPVIGTGAWTVTAGTATVTDPLDPNSGVTGLTTGVNTFTWTITNGTCTPSTDAITINVDQLPTTSNAGIDQTICSPTATLAANTPAIGTGAWTVTAGTGVVTTPSSPTSGVTGLSTGVNTFTWTITNGTCTPSTDAITINVDQLPTTSNAGIDQTICSPTATLAANTPTVGTGAWTVTAGTGVVTTPSSPTSGVTGLSTGVNTFTWTITNGTCTPSTDAITINVDQLPTTSNAGIDQTICSPTATLAANTPTVGTGAWTVTAGTGVVTTPSSPTSGVTGLTTGVNTFVWTITNGTCTPSTDAITINVDQLPTTSNAGIDQTICSPTATLAANTPAIGTGAWTVTAGTGVVTTPSSPTSGVTGLTTGVNTFVWTITNGTCTPSADAITINVDQLPTTSNAGIDQTICSPTATLAANTPTVGTGTWTVTAGTGVVTTPSSPTSGVTGLTTGVNTFVWTITNGTCTPSTDAITINVDQLPTTSNAGIDQTICSPTATLAANTPTVGTGTWTVTAGTGVVTAPSSPTSGVTGLTTGVNTFVWTITNGTCTPSTDAITINVDQLPTTSNAGIDQTICSPTATLAANTPAIGTGAWTVTAGTATVTDPLDPNSGVTGLTTGVNTFTWTITNGTCTPSTDAITINVDQLPTTSNAGIDQTICSPTATLAANTPTIGTGAWTVTAGTGVVTTPSSPTSGVTGLTTGVNTFTWTITNGTCTPSADAITINVDQLPTVADAGIDQTICSPTATLAANTPAVGAGAWTVTAGTATVTDPLDPELRSDRLNNRRKYICLDNYKRNLYSKHRCDNYKC
ncbi:MAG: hypothetical protein IPP32_04285 [Bacteroidetes bacterium]|nr:hypothetical protein [Bacteroidota bacterium]